MKDHPATSQPVNSAGAPTAAAQEVLRLLAAGKCKQAVELAKDEHKRRNTFDSEKLVVDAYAARIAQFQQKGAVEDAQTLLKLVRERFPMHQARFSGLRIQTAVSAGKMEELLAPLAKGDVPEETRAAIDTAIRQQLVDLGSLATCESLPADHPLRVAAAATWKAFAAVTAGPVTEEQIALPEVSRRSPLAGWKMLVRAIFAFHGRDDDACRHALEGIPADAAARRPVGVILAMIEGKPVGGGMAGALQARIGGDGRALREALLGFERALANVDPGMLRRQVREALGACTSAFPDMRTSLMQRIFVRCMMAGVPKWELDRVMASPPEDAAFWRLIARADERRGMLWQAALAWDNFQRYAVREGMIRAGSVEQAVVFQHAGELLAQLSPEEIYDQQERYREARAAMPPDARRAQAGHSTEIAEMDPGAFFARAARIVPDAQTFKQWWKWAEGAGLSDYRKEDVAKAWRQAIPGDPEPCLILSDLTEKRNALKMAMGHLEDAEAIDAFDPRVRRARVRITMGILWKHLKDRKAHLVQKDLAELEAMPAMNERDHGAFLSVLRAAWHMLRNDRAEATKALGAASEQIGVLAVEILVLTVKHGTKLVDCENWPVVEVPAVPDPRAVADAYGRTVRMAEALSIRLWRPTAWIEIVEKYVRDSGATMTHADLLTIGRSGQANQRPQMAYMASAAGLASAAGPMAARFLLLRARSLPGWASGRISQCLRAAMELAETSHDEALMKEVLCEIEQHAPTRQARTRGGSAGRKLGGELLAEIIKSERAAKQYPADRATADKHLVAIESDAPPLKPVDFATSFDDDDDDDDDDNDDFADEDEDDEYDDDPMPDLPQEVMGIIREMLEKFGRIPSPEELMKRHPFLAMRLAVAMGGMKMDPGTLEDLADGLMNGPPQHKRKKKRGR
ncbi:MAG: hypothetical protein ACHRHE_10230 [Tepidisphaerales bacterium]